MQIMNYYDERGKYVQIYGSSTLGKSGCLVTSPPEGVARYCFHPVCLSVCVCVFVCVSGLYFGILFLSY